MLAAPVHEVDHAQGFGPGSTAVTEVAPV